MCRDGDAPGRPVAVVVTCEHAGNAVPPAFKALFRGESALLKSHRGWDPGALGVAVRLAGRVHAPLLHTTVTRLLVEPNRSPGEPGFFSAFTLGLPEAEREAIVEAYWVPHRRGVRRTIGALIGSGCAVAHVGVHSFVDELDGAARGFDLGLLFDPSRAWESALCDGWRSALGAARETWRVLFNEPYLGTDDGLTTWLRTEFDDGAYAGVEVEVRQGMLGRASARRAVGEALGATLWRALGAKL